MKKLFLVIAILTVLLITGCFKNNEIDDNNMNNQQQEVEQNNGYSDEQLVEMAKAYRRLRGEFVPEFVEIAEKSGNIVKIHLYDMTEDHTATSDWYTIDRYTGKGTNILDEDIDLTDDVMEYGKKEIEELSDLLKERFNFVDLEDNAMYPILNSELNEEEISAIEYSRIINIDNGSIYLLNINKNIDDFLFEKLKHIDIGSWYRYYDEEFFIICNKNISVIALANNELNAPDTDASVIKNVCKEYFGEENIERMYEEQLNGNHRPIEEVM